MLNILAKQKGNKVRMIAVVIILVALVVIGAVVLMKSQEYAAGVDFYQSLR